MMRHPNAEWIDYVADGYVQYDGINTDFGPIWSVTPKGRTHFHLDLYDAPIIENLPMLNEADKAVYDALCARIQSEVATSVANAAPPIHRKCATITPAVAPKRVRTHFTDLMALIAAVLIVAIIL